MVQCRTSLRSGARLQASRVAARHPSAVPGGRAVTVGAIARLSDSAGEGGQAMAVNGCRIALLLLIAGMAVANAAPKYSARRDGRPRTRALHSIAGRSLHGPV